MFSSVFSFHFLPFLFQFQQHTSQFLQGLGSGTETQVTLRIPTPPRGFGWSSSSSDLKASQPVSVQTQQHSSALNNKPQHFPAQRARRGLEASADQQQRYQRNRPGREKSKTEPSPSAAALASWPPARCSSHQTAQPWQESDRRIRGGALINSNKPLPGLLRRSTDTGGAYFTC